MTDPATMCRQHLLGEHLELHMFVGSINKGLSLQGYIDAGLVETASIAFRHEQLVQEMARRGFQHASPLYYTDSLNQGQVPRDEARGELHRRCSRCAELARERAGAPA